MATRPISNVINVWNQNTTYTGIGLNIIDTLSGTDSKLLNLQINSSSKFYVDKSGNVVATGNVSSNKFTASYVRIGSAPITSQYTFEDNSTPNLYSNKIRAYSASFTYLEIISGSAPRSTMPFISNVEEIKGRYDGYQGQANPNNTQYIRFRKNPDDDVPIIDIEVGNNLEGNFGAVNVVAEEVYVGGMYGEFGPNFGKIPIEINHGSISISPKNPNDCVEINGCLEVSGNLKVKGMKIGPDSLYLSSSLTDSRIHGTNLSISSSFISASRMHVGGKTKTTQYKFSDGSKPDLYVNKLRAYSGSFTSLEIISGSEGSMSIKNDKGQVIFQARQTGNTDEVSMFDNIGKFFKEKDPVTGKNNTDFIFGAAGSGKNSVKFDYTDVVMGMSSSISGNLAIQGGWKLGIGGVTGTMDATGSVQIGTKDANGQVQGIILDKVKLTATDISTNYKNIDGKLEAAVYQVTGGATNYFGTHSITVNNAAVVKIDGTNAPVELKQQINGALFLNLGRSLIKTGTQSLWITGSTISGSELNVYAPDFNSKINTYHITGSSGNFNSFNFSSITASAKITASSAGASSGKYAKIKIGTQTYKILLYADS